MILSFCKIYAQNYIPADPNYLLIHEKNQFNNLTQFKSNNFRPLFFSTDSSSLSLIARSEFYFNDNAPNQENMDVRYFSKGIGNFMSIQVSFNSPYLSLILEPYQMHGIYHDVETINRSGTFSVLNDQTLGKNQLKENSGFRNLLAFVHYKGLGIGWHKGNRWWGPGIHSSLQMTNNTFPIPTQIIGTIQEIKYKSFGFYGLYSFSKLNDNSLELEKYHTALNGQITWYGPIILSIGFSRNYLSGGVLSTNDRVWSEKDAKLLVFEGFLTKNLIGKEYAVGGHDAWDQTLSGYLTITLPKRNFKVYAEFGVNDNRMFLADLISQPDHTLATIIGFRDYGVGASKNWIYGFEWNNSMITYTSRFRGTTGTPAWYSKKIYSYSSYLGRRWASHSGSDADDWYIYAGYLSNKFMIVPAINYERHGIVTYRPAEVKFEFRLDMRYQYKNMWLGLFFEKQYEAFLGFPDYYYEDKNGELIDANEGSFSNTRKTNTLIFSIYKKFNL